MEIQSNSGNFREHLAQQGLRVTNQRLAIFDAALDSEDHFTAEDLLERVRKIDLRDVGAAQARDHDEAEEAIAIAIAIVTRAPSLS